MVEQAASPGLHRSREDAFISATHPTLESLAEPLPASRANPSIGGSVQHCTRPALGCERTSTEIESMTCPSLMRVSALAALLAAVACEARAQSDSAGTPITPLLRYSVGGGFADGPPFGGSGRSNNLGYHLTAAAELRTLWSPLRLRADGLFANWGNDQRLSAVTAGA